MPRSATRFLIVRHGQSEWNAAGRWQGQTDVPLSELGRRQAIVATNAVGPVDAVISSDLERARVTAELMAAELGVAPVRVDPDLRERDAGEWSGLTRSEIHDQWPGFLSDGGTPAGRAAPRRPPSWESDAQLLERVLRSLRHWARELSGNDILAVAHGGVVYALEHHLGQPSGRMANLDGRWVTVVNDTLSLGDRVSLLDPEQVRVTAPEAI